MKRSRWVYRYLGALSRGFLIMVLLLTWDIRMTKTGWYIPVTIFTTWIFLSWLVCYPGLRQRYRSLYSRNGERFETYKHRALAMHHQDISDNHVKHRWTTKGVVVNPWEYTTGTTQSTDGILNPVLVFCEHLWATFLLILFGPLLVGYLAVTKLVRWGWQRLAKR